MNCLRCHEPLDPALAPEVTHPACSTTSFRFDEEPGEAFNQQLKRDIIAMALSAEQASPRSNQSRLGPSEIGDPCDRRLAYRLTGAAHVNVGFDPWPTIVGTSIHAWMEKAATAWNGTQPEPDRWRTEQTLEIDNGMFEGHCDIYRNCVVSDYKTAGPNVMKKVREDGPPENYVVQTQIYGLGYRQAGFCVERVALIFLPRAGWLRDAYIWSTPYDEQVARSALDRVYGIAAAAVQLDVINQPHRYQQIPCKPTDYCGSCPWFNSLLMAEEGASDKGCPATE